MSRLGRDPQRRREICKRFAKLLDELEQPSLARLASQMGYGSPSTIYAVVKGDNLPDVEKLYRLGTQFQTAGKYPNIDWIITGRGSMFLDRANSGNSGTNKEDKYIPTDPEAINDTPGDLGATDEYASILRQLKTQPVEKLKAFLTILT